MRYGLLTGSFGPTLRAVRAPLLALSFGLIVLIGLGFVYWTKQAGIAAGKPPDSDRDGRVHAAQKRNEEIDRRFSSGAALLNMKQFEAAASEFHRVLELAPQMPEAHVNMGFAMIGVQRYATARDFFNAAIDLNRNQHNAYFGLAVALEGLHDLPGALGAMRSYVHLSKAADAYLPKANAAIWEWEAALKKSPGSNGGNRQALEFPENEKNAIAYPIREKKIN